MRQHKILTRTLLILSIINFVLAAPAAVRGRPGVRLDGNVTGNVTAASQKRAGSMDEGGVNERARARPCTAAKSGLDKYIVADSVRPQRPAHTHTGPGVRPFAAVKPRMGNNPFAAVKPRLGKYTVLLRTLPVPITGA